MGYNGAEMVIEALRNENIDTVFAYPGGAVIPIFDVLYHAKDIKVVLTRHEQAAVHGADAYARATGKTGVCIVTSGPGATNTVTGLATANFDSVPLVCISGQVPRNMIGNDAFQEADTVGITRPVTKHNYIVTERSLLGRRMKEAFHIASTGRPGPVVVDIPKDILMQNSEDEYPQQINLAGYTPPSKGHRGQLRRAAAAINAAKKPLFFAGGGINVGNASELYREMMAATGIPSVSSLMGIGAVETSNDLNLGMIGMHGTYTANMAVSDCDLLFGIGVRFDDRATGALDRFAPHAKIIHLDIDPAAIARNVPVEVPIVGDAVMVLEALTPLLEKKDRSGWIGQIEEWKKEAACRNAYEGSRADESENGFLMPEEVLNAVSDKFPDAVVTTEVGQNQMWTALHWKFDRPRSLITSGGLGTMGYGFPAAVGAAMAGTGRPVVAIAGDGSFQMNLQELATAVKNRLPIVIVILNNGYLGMVRQWQQMFNDGRYSSTHLNDRTKGCPDKVDADGSPDFIKLADAFGAEGRRACNMEELSEALNTAAEMSDRPIIIDCIIEPEANVWPMVPPGAGLEQMLFSTEKENAGENK